MRSDHGPETTDQRWAFVSSDLPRLEVGMVVCVNDPSSPEWARGLMRVVEVSGDRVLVVPIEGVADVSTDGRS